MDGLADVLFLSVEGICRNHWKASSPFEQATSSTYALGGLDSGHEIAVEVGATNSAGTTWAISVADIVAGAQPSTANEWVSESGGSCNGAYPPATPTESSKACARSTRRFRKGGELW